MNNLTNPMTGESFDLADRLAKCSTAKQMTRLVKDMVAVDPNRGVSAIVQTIFAMEGEEGRRLSQMWLDWLKA